MEEITFQDIMDNGYKFEDDGVKNHFEWMWTRGENDDVYYPSTKIKH